jgi:hypothetical protein
LDQASQRFQLQLFWSINVIKLIYK